MTAPGQSLLPSLAPAPGKDFLGGTAASEQVLTIHAQLSSDVDNCLIFKLAVLII